MNFDLSSRAKTLVMSRVDQEQKDTLEIAEFMAHHLQQHFLFGLSRPQIESKISVVTAQTFQNDLKVLHLPQKTAAKGESHWNTWLRTELVAHLDKVVGPAAKDKNYMALLCQGVPSVGFASVSFPAEYPVLESFATLQWAYWAAVEALLKRGNVEVSSKVRPGTFVFENAAASKKFQGWVRKAKRDAEGSTEIMSRLACSFDICGRVS